MAREIEVKAKVKNFETIVQELQKLGCVLSEPITQDDYIYNVKGWDVSGGHKNTSVLRIREQKDKIFFTLKQNLNNELDCIEKEMEIKDKKTMAEIFEILGFEKTVEVHKKRRKTNYRDYEICLDEVDGLGSFIEVEKLSDEDDNSGEKVQEELFDFLGTLGVSKNDRVMNGYDTLMWREEHKK